MTAYRIIGDNLVDEDEFAAKGLGGKLLTHQAGGKLANMMLSNKSLLAFDQGPIQPIFANNDATPLPPIAYGKPMTVDIRHVYTGRVGTKSIFGDTGDVAVVSGVREWSAIRASARALNFVSKGKAKREHLAGPSALTDGTRAIAYQKAVATRQVIVTLEIVAADKEDGFASKLGKAFSAAAGIPLFLPYSGALLAAGQLIPIAGKLASALAGGKSPWSESAEINFGYPGEPESTAEFRLVAPRTAGLDRYKFKRDIGLVGPGDVPYSGDEPYVVIAIYGGVNTDLENFTPAVAGADFLGRFYSAQQGVGGVLDDLVEVMQIASDFKFRKAADDLKRRLEGATPGSDEAKAFQAQIDAAIKNITEPAMKPK